MLVVSKLRGLSTHVLGQRFLGGYIAPGYRRVLPYLNSPWYTKSVRYSTTTPSLDIQDSIANIFTKIQSRKSTLSSLHEIPGVLQLEAPFIERINKSIKAFNSNPSKYKKPEEIRIIDYVNPRIENFPQILTNINNGRSPKELKTFYDIASNDDLIETVLEKLLYKFHFETAIFEQDTSDRTIDFSNPAQWFPETRKMKRKIIMHVGPTNSGKTFQSLKKLEVAKSGYYAGPLRLLAREIYESFNKKGISCNLVTGEEVQASFTDDGKISQISSGTLEMIPLSKKMDLCIIDEIQMIEDSQRGEAWTNAILGVQAKEIHVCGEERAVGIIKSLAKLTGDEVEVNRYERLGKLEVADRAVRNFSNLQPGDCVVSFSKAKILQLKLKIEQSTKLKVAVIYGALPPEIRSQQAHGFNTGQYDVLVASDAIGMGLNLAIKRIVFSTISKYNGYEMEELSKSSVRQIGGRAGRFSHDKNKLGGVVTTLTHKDLKFIQKNMKAHIPDIEKACIWPTDELWTSYIAKFPKETSTLAILHEFCKSKVNSSHFFLTNVEARLDVMSLMAAKGFDKQMSIEDQIRLSIAPMNTRVKSDAISTVLYAFVENIIKTKSKSILDFEFLPLEILLTNKRNQTVGKTFEELATLEDSHRLVLIFMWLSQRWPNLFVDIESAYDWKSLIEKRISEELTNLKESRRKGKWA